MPSPFLYRLFSPLSQGRNLTNLIDSTGEYVIMPFYHAIGPEQKPYFRQLYSMPTPEVFREDLLFLLKHFEPIQTDELLKWTLAGRPKRKPALWLSFDDGFKCIYEFAVPILEELGVPATFFINPAFVDNKSFLYRLITSLILDKIIKKKPGKTQEKEINNLLFDWGYQGGEMNKNIRHMSYIDKPVLKKIAQVLEIDADKIIREAKPYMTTEELKTLARKGFSIGSHSLDHPLLSEMHPTDRWYQIEESTNLVQDEFKQKHRLFAFPFTDYGLKKEFFNRLFEPGNELVDLSFGTAGFRRGRIIRHLQRLPMDMDRRNLNGEKIVKGEYFNCRLKKLVGKYRIRRE
jgi:peptidoglycan/xylan/chitin deacetylase (PgdA/CDA1 family)